MKEMLLRYQILVAISAGIVVVLAGGAGWAAALSGSDERPLWRTTAAFPEPVAKPTPSKTPEAAKTISMSSVGDIVMVSETGSLPANDGHNFFDQVKPLFTADLVMGNLEQTLTDNTGYGKCGPEAENCRAFRAPPRYAERLRDAGFHLLNQANNHGYDFGPQGYTNTQKALEAAGLKHTGARNLITIAEVKGMKVAVLGFSSYSRDNPLTDIAAARAIVAKAAEIADIVAIQVHWGAEGADKGHVKPGTEYYLGENRGDPIAFSHAVIDAGADIIFGHGPHTVRAMEIYKGRLIAYSLGNFAGGTGLKGGEIVGWGGVLKATVTTQGALVSGNFASTIFDNSPGVPRPDPQGRALKRVQELTMQDFPTTGTRFGADGSISTV
jgi:hypothetical protein